MESVLERIKTMDDQECHRTIEAVEARFAEMFPEYMLQFITLEKGKDMVEDYDRMITMLKRLKEYYIKTQNIKHYDVRKEPDM